MPKRKRKKVYYRAKDRRTDPPLLKAFQKEWNGFKQEKLKVQLALIHCMRQAYRKKREHRENPDAFYMHYTELEHTFGRNGFKQANERLGLFHVDGTGSPSRRVTKQYQLDAKADRIYARVLHKKPRGTLLRAIDANGRFINTAPKPILAKDTSGVTAKFWGNEVTASLVSVDIAALDRLAEQIEDAMQNGDMFVMANKAKLEHRLMCLAELRREAHYEFTGPGNIAHSYQESKTGRLSAIGTNLQSSPRTIRKVALQGYWDYDFENCHYAILHQMAARFDLHCEHINDYLQHKQAVRQALANDIRVGISQIKRVLIALIYGAHASSSRYAALYDAIPDREKLKRLIQNATFQNLHRDIKQARNVILANWAIRRGRLINDCNRGILATEDAAKRLAHLIQGAEAHMLRTALRCYPSEIILLLHDGFVASHRLNTRVIQQQVNAETGYDIALTEEKIQPGFDFDIDAL